MLSVITPCKNIVKEGREEFFRKMMTTLYQQTYTNFEHIVIDAGSEDGTLDILKEYQKVGQINILISEKDRNVHEAMNKGLKLAKGEYIHVMNSDNYFAVKDFFERSLNAIEKYRVDYTHADRVIVHRDGTENTIKRGDIRTAFFRMPFRYQTMLIKKELYDEFGPFDEKYEIAADYKFMLKMILAGKKGYYFPEVLIYSLDGGITSDRQKCIDEVTEVLYESYGKKYDLMRDECRDIYLRKISPTLLSKIIKNVDDTNIKKSLIFCYETQDAK